MFKFDKEKSKQFAIGTVSIIGIGCVSYGLATAFYPINTMRGQGICLYSFSALLGVLGTVNYAFKVSKEDKNKTTPSVKVTNMVESEPCTETVGMANAKKYFRIVNR